MPTQFFIRYGIAQDVSSRMRYLGESVNEAANGAIENLGKAGGGGGVIALDRYGNGELEQIKLLLNWQHLCNNLRLLILVAMPFNTSGMYRGYIRVSDGIPHVYI